MFKLFNELKQPKKIYPSLFDKRATTAGDTVLSDLFIYIVGCGGTGGYLIPQIARLISVKNTESLKVHLVVVDADDVEEKNLTRQNFVRKDLGKKKANVLAQRYSKAFGIDIHAIAEYLPASTNQTLLLGWFEDVEKMIRVAQTNAATKRIIIGCVDNVNTRKAIKAAYDYFSTVNNNDTIAWIDAGNSNYAGQVILSTSLRNNGCDHKLASFFDVFPGLLSEKVKDHPDELSCADHALSAPQNIAANITASNLIFNYFNILYHNSLLLKENLTTESPRMIGAVIEEMWSITTNIVYFDVSTNSFKNELLLTRREETYSDFIYSDFVSSFETSLINYRTHFKSDSEVSITINNSAENEIEQPQTEESENTESVTETSAPSFCDIFDVFGET